MDFKTTLRPSDTFVERHIGPRANDLKPMLDTVGFPSLDALIDATIPKAIRCKTRLKLDPPRGEYELLNELRAIASQNRVYRSYIGMGYANCITPPVIQRNILENPGWYTQYTPYQAEIAQGRLEALLNFQTMVADLTGLPLANSSLLDEATAAAEAMTMSRALGETQANRFFVAESCHPQTIAVLKTRAEPLGIHVDVGNLSTLEGRYDQYFGILLQYPTTTGVIEDYRAIIEKAHAHNAFVTVATDLLALAVLTPPGEFGADIAVGSCQRFGVPLGYGGPHAAFLATREEHKRHIPGRLVGVSRDARGKSAYRLTLQTREQHIRRDKATSNICTAQVLLAIMASMYAVYHGPKGLRRIATRVRGWTLVVAEGLTRLGYSLESRSVFDTLHISVAADVAARLQASASSKGINLRVHRDRSLGISLDETTTEKDVLDLFEIFSSGKPLPFTVSDLSASIDDAIAEPFARKSDVLSHPVFNRYHAEHEMLRYLHRLQNRDLSLTSSMIPLGSCTMKLNATSEMLPISWPEFAMLHPYAPREQTAGYQTLFRQLETWLAEITGFDAVSLQPNAGSQGEYAGLLVIRAYHAARREGHRNVCLIPSSAHGTNPASAVMAGYNVVSVACDERGNIDLDDLQTKSTTHRDRLAAMMVTYPSTHGVFETRIRELCAIVHDAGGQVYLDGANMNAQVGLCRPGDYGADVCHLNLHKTFCIPHGGGGPGMGPIAVAKHLAPYLPGDPVADDPNASARAVSAAHYGSASILPISWMYIGMMGEAGLRRATEIAILNANYMAKRLAPHYEIVFTGEQGTVAHEFILDARAFKKSANITPEDIAKRLMDYGFHAPTMSWPVAGTLMIEPTESESKEELDRFCDALISIRDEIRAIEEGRMSREDNPLINAPHTAEMVTATEWSHPYRREQAAYPAPWLKQHKFWPSVARIDNTYGDRHVFCTCPPMDAYTG